MKILHKVREWREGESMYSTEIFVSPEEAHEFAKVIVNRIPAHERADFITLELEVMARAFYPAKDSTNDA